MGLFLGSSQFDHGALDWAESDRTGPDLTACPRWLPRPVVALAIGSVFHLLCRSNWSRGVQRCVLHPVLTTQMLRIVVGLGEAVLPQETHLTHLGRSLMSHRRRLLVLNPACLSRLVKLSYWPRPRPGTC